jgi:hypothetical protein
VVLCVFSLWFLSHARQRKKNNIKGPFLFLIVKNMLFVVVWSIGDTFLTFFVLQYELCFLLSDKLFLFVYKRKVRAAIELAISFFELSFFFAL